MLTWLDKIRKNVEKTVQIFNPRSNKKRELLIRYIYKIVWVGGLVGWWVGGLVGFWFRLI